MNKEIIQKIINSIESSFSNNQNDVVLFSGKGYESIPISENNFYSFDNIKPKNQKLAFVDGGNLELIGSPSFSLQFLRIYACVYNNNKRIAKKKFEFYLLISAKNKDNKIFYSTDIYPTIEQIENNPEFFENLNLSFNSNKVYLKKSGQRTPISEIGNVIRRFCEIKLAKELITEKLLDEKDSLVLDGNLECTYVNEKEFFDELYDIAQEKNVIVSALAKTSRLLTNNANSIVLLLSNMKSGTWVYHPIAKIENKNHKAEMHFIRLHENSKYVFRYELYKEQKGKINEVLPLLKINSTDAAFPGYPYGLIDADRFARVSLKEAERLRLYFLACSKDKRIHECINALNAHSILDSVG